MKRTPLSLKKINPDSSQLPTSFFSRLPLPKTLKNSKYSCQTCDSRLSLVLQIQMPLSSKILHFCYCLNSLCDEFGSMDDQSADNFFLEYREAPLIQVADFSAEAYEIIPEGESKESSQQLNFESQIGGVPSWIQEESYSHCSSCKNNRSMTYELQLVVPEINGLPFPAGSLIYVSKCRLHEEQMGMVWQCS